MSLLSDIVSQIKKVSLWILLLRAFTYCPREWLAIQR